MVSFTLLVAAMSHHLYRVARIVYDFGPFSFSYQSADLRWSRSPGTRQLNVSGSCVDADWRTALADGCGQRPHILVCYNGEGDAFAVDQLLGIIKSKVPVPGFQLQSRRIFQR